MPYSMKPYRITTYVHFEQKELQGRHLDIIAKEQLKSNLRKAIDEIVDNSVVEHKYIQDTDTVKYWITLGINKREDIQ